MPITNIQLVIEIHFWKIIIKAKPEMLYISEMHYFVNRKNDIHLKTIKNLLCSVTCDALPIAAACSAGMLPNGYDSSASGVALSAYAEMVEMNR